MSRPCRELMTPWQALHFRLRWQYGDPYARMDSEEWKADVEAWRRIGREQSSPPTDCPACNPNPARE